MDSLLKAHEFKYRVRNCKWVSLNYFSSTSAILSTDLSAVLFLQYKSKVLKIKFYRLKGQRLFLSAIFWKKASNCDSNHFWIVCKFLREDSYSSVTILY
jgi:hypothetical protein